MYSDGKSMRNKYKYLRLNIKIYSGYTWRYSKSKLYKSIIDQTKPVLSSENSWNIPSDFKCLLSIRRSYTVTNTLKMTN